MGEIVADLIAARDALLKQVRNQMLGPGSEYSIPTPEEEIITDSPEKRYSTGILFPQVSGAGLVQEQVADEPDIEDDNAEVDIAESELDSYLGMTDYSSAMGLSFLAKGDTNVISCKLEVGTYRALLRDECRVPNNTDIDYDSLPQAVRDRIKLVDGGKNWGVQNIPFNRSWID